MRVDILAEFMRHELELPWDHPQGHPRRSGYAPPLLPSLARKVRFEEGSVAGIGGLWTIPRAAAHRDLSGSPVLVYLHGGGYTTCSPRTHRAIVAELAAASGRRVFAPDYRLAPEHPYPAALDDALTVVRALREVAGEITLGGDSAGGGLALAVLLTLRDAREPMPSRAVLISPWVDLTLSADSIDENAPFDYLSRDILERSAAAYAAAEDRHAHRISPLLAELAGLPPLLIQVGGMETLRDEAVALARRARGAGVRVDLEVEEGAFHVFQAFVPLVPGAADALRRAAAFLRGVDGADTPP